MKTKCITIIALTVGLSAFNMVAQPNGRPEHRPGQGQGGQGSGRPEGGPSHKMMVPPMIAAIDANHDGTISAEEISGAPAALKGLDKNSDGQLTGEELRPMPPKDGGEHKEGERRGPRPDGEKRPDGERKGPPPAERGEGNFHPPVPPMIGALDANGDKTISADEIANASAALKKLDKNGDGQLTKEEVRPEPPPRGEK